MNKIVSIKNYYYYYYYNYDDDDDDDDNDYYCSTLSERALSLADDFVDLLRCDLAVRASSDST